MKIDTSAGWLNIVYYFLITYLLIKYRYRYRHRSISSIIISTWYRNQKIWYRSIGEMWRTISL